MPLNTNTRIPRGLHYIPDFLTPEESEKLLSEIDAGEWVPISEHEGARRVQQFGALYVHRSAMVEEKNQEPWPEWCLELGKKVVDEGHLSIPPQQAIINEYFPGQGIASHIDHPDGFGPVVISITLNSPVTLDLLHGESCETWSLHLGVGSLIVLSGESRYTWKHGIAKRDFDMVDGRKIQRGRRVSVTFRTLN